MKHTIFSLCALWLVAYASVPGKDAETAFPMRKPRRSGKGARRIIANITKAQKTQNISFKGKILYLHFHKAGGSSMCRAFQATGLKVGGHNCNCKGFSVPRFVRFGDRDLCAIERPAVFGTVKNFETFITGFNGRKLLTLRDPWERFLSTYLMNTRICKSTKCSPKVDITANMFYEMKVNHKVYVNLYGYTNRPNYYTRFLNGLGKSPKDVMDDRHLKIAKRILQNFDAVVFLEQDPEERASRIAEVLGVDSFAMDREKAFTTKEVSDEYRDLRNRYIQDSGIDYQLYRWAAEHFNATLVS